ncbi:MAG TPA: tripartite tricarboxylate transporter substrate binding protein [Xanthobacteraceae bacterium]|nr:tripartite tricarboxylate transporter substrate binding protein [Xanthobacteraceae bacterium]
MIALLAGAAGAFAQSYPSAKPIMIVCAQPPGSGPDTMARLYAEVMGRSMNQKILVSNQPGAGGVLAASTVAQAAPDGYTLLLVLNGTHTTIPHMQSLKFDPIKDFEFVSMLYSSSSILLVATKGPVKSFAELIDLAKTKPGGATYGSPAIGSPSHLMGALLAESTKIPMTHVAYRGGVPMLTDLVGGSIDFAFLSSLQALGQIEQGLVRAIAAADTRRFPQLPDVPTLAELGYGDVIVESWFGIAVPKGTPPDIIARLNAELQAASKDPAIIKRAEQDMATIRTGPRQEIDKLLAEDYARMGSAVKRLGVKSE